MATIEVFGRVKEDGTLEIKDPHLHAGTTVKITITELEEGQNAASSWTEEELQALMQRDEPKTGAEIAAWLRANPDTGGWGDMDIPDAGEWVRNLRHNLSYFC